MKRGLLLLLILIFAIGCSSNVKVEVAPVKEKIMEPSAIQEETTETVQEVKEINLVAKQFSFNPNPIIVNEGEKVKLILTTEDVEHGFSIIGYGINEKIKPSETTIVEFTADKVGEFDIICSVVCGSGHSGMRGKLIVKWKCNRWFSFHSFRFIHFIEKEKKCLKNTVH